MLNFGVSQARATSLQPPNRCLHSSTLNHLVFFCMCDMPLRTCRPMSWICAIFAKDNVLPEPASSLVAEVAAVQFNLVVWDRRDSSSKIGVNAPDYTLPAASTRLTWLYHSMQGRGVPCTPSLPYRSVSYQHSDVRQKTKSKRTRAANPKRDARWLRQ